ncbi:hypothetical protein SAMN05216378_5440 [Paenibacillus catalpae]|uniref:4-O-methyl-glucuronoyl methylesterase-like domain-containing protein n=2 Tax=Paenibacillus catalpae TaxID=1045775 RepID=A0A1I2GSW1_9BACL|nr:hypothetical protein SAMN05216378_5440 [Paenibacillus catalpae]
MEKDVLVLSIRKGTYISPADLPLKQELPDPFTFEDGRRVLTVSDWEERSEELQDMYHYYMYGYKPDTSGEQVSYEKTEQGLQVQVTRELYSDIDATRAVVTGFSRWGKASLVIGMMDKRFALINPHASGAGGMASFRYSLEGKVYPWGTAGRSEPLDALHSESLAHWFNSVFLAFKDPAALPFDQHELAALMAPRALLLTGGYEDDWVNPEGMYVSYAEAERVYKFLGAENQIGIAYRSGGHNRTQEDISHLLDYCDWRLRGIQPKTTDFKSSLYEPWRQGID